LSQISHYTVLSPPQTEGKGVSLQASVIGNPPESGRFLLFPGKQTVRLKQVHSIPGGKDVILELKGLSRSRLNRGDQLISEDTGASEGRKALVIWKKKITAGDSLSLHLRDTPGLKSRDSVSCSEGSKTVILSSRIPFLQIPGQIYTLSQGSQSGECLLLMAEPWTTEELKNMKARMNKISNFPGEDAVYSMNLRVRGAIVLPPHLMEKKFEGSVKLGGWVLMSRVYDKALATVEKRCRAEEGIAEDELPDLLGLPLRLCREICDLLIREDKIIRIRGTLFNQCDDHRAFLSPMSRMWLENLQAAGAEGIPLKETFKLGRRLDAMEKRGLIRVFETFAVEQQAFQSLVDSFLTLLPRGTSFELSDLKGLLDLSRSRLLLVLSVLEEDGKVLTTEDHKRTVVEAVTESRET
jgi:hypothetical protein